MVKKKKKKSSVTGFEVRNMLSASCPMDTRSNVFFFSLRIYSIPVWCCCTLASAHKHRKKAIYIYDISFNLMKFSFFFCIDFFSFYIDLNKSFRFLSKVAKSSGQDFDRQATQTRKKKTFMHFRDLLTFCRTPFLILASFFFFFFVTCRRYYACVHIYRYEESFQLFLFVFVQKRTERRVANIKARTQRQ